MSDDQRNLSALLLRDPSPSWIPRDTDTRPSQAMPSAGHADWREQAEWWERTCIWWREQAQRERDRADSAESLTKYAQRVMETAEEMVAENRRPR